MRNLIQGACWLWTATHIFGFSVSVFGVAIVSPALADAEIFRANCAACHPRATILAQRLKGDTANERKATLETFLSAHHAEDPAIRARVVAYLVDLAAN